MRGAEHAANLGDIADMIESANVRLGMDWEETARQLRAAGRALAAADTPWMTTEQAGAYCGGMSARTLEGYRREGGGPPYHRVGARVLYDRTDLGAWIKAGGKHKHIAAEKLGGALAALSPNEH